MGERGPKAGTVYRRGAKSPTTGKHGRTAERVPLADKAYWTPHRIRVLELLLDGKPVADVAKDVKRHHSAIYQLMRSEPFAAELHAAQTERIEAAKSRLCAEAEGAVNHLVHLSRNATKQEFGQIVATKALLDLLPVSMAKREEEQSSELGRLSDEQIEAKLLAEADAIRQRGGT